jgi:hypothetical protein
LVLNNPFFGYFRKRAKDNYEFLLVTCPIAVKLRFATGNVLATLKRSALPDFLTLYLDSTFANQKMVGLI